MKILHIPNYYKPHIGGIEQVCHDITEACIQEEQKVICFSEDKEDKQGVIDGVEVIKCGVWKKILSQSISFSYNKKLKEMIEGFNPECIIFHFPNPFVSHFLLKCLKNKNIRLIVWYHSDIVKQKFVRLFFQRQTKKILSLADQIVCTSPIYKKTSNTLKPFQDKIDVIPNCINEERLALSEEEEVRVKQLKEENANKNIVFAYGRHVKYKGMEYLVKAAEYLDENYQIYIAGTGPLTESLQEMNKNENVHFLGKISDSELRVYLQAMDIFAFPSITKNEAFGLALAEAMYFSHPAVTFKIPGSGVNYVNIHGETGIEVPNQDVKAFAEAIKQLGEDKSLNKMLGVNASHRVNNLFLFEQFKESVLELIEEN